MADTNKIAADFLAAIPETRRERSAEALKLVLDGAQAGSILNVDYEEAKRVLNHSVDQAFDIANKVGYPDGGFYKLPADVQKLHWDCRVMSVHDVIATSKKLTKTTAQHPVIDSMRAFCAAVLPVALMMADLKGKVVKGRRPPTPEQVAERAAKLASVKPMERATCGCCFKQQAVLPNGLIHDHGYQLPREWMKTRSCYGRRFRPLEVSDEGPRFMVDLLEKAEADAVRNVKKTREATRHSWLDWNRKERSINIGEVGWKSRHASFVSQAEHRLEQIQRDLAEFRKIVAEWKPAA